MSVPSAPASTLDVRTANSCEPAGTVVGYSFVPGSVPDRSGRSLVLVIFSPGLTCGAARPQPALENGPAKPAFTPVRGVLPESVVALTTTRAGALTDLACSETGSRTVREPLRSTIAPKV